MPIDLDNVFGAYTREELQEALRSIDPKKNPEDYDPTGRTAVVGFRKIRFELTEYEQSEGWMELWLAKGKQTRPLIGEGRAP